MPRRSLRMILLALALLVGAGAALSAPGRPTAAAQPEPVVTFDLTVSLEWQPGVADNLLDDMAIAGCTREAARAQFLDDLIEGLRATSAYLYNSSEGQMALGKVTIYTGGEHWSDADIRILADSSYRPTAFVGGIVGAPTVYISATTGISTTFYPGEIVLGRLWNGRGARCGPWSAHAGWSTIGHEWGHYALFLYDEYFNHFTLAEQYCSSRSAGLPASMFGDPTIVVSDSLMAFHYQADELWLRDSPLPPSCAGTPQTVIHGISDWNTIKRFYAAVQVPVSVAPGPVFAGSPAEALFSATIVSPTTPLTTTSAVVALDAPTSPRLVGQTYLVRPRPDGNGLPLRILGQGELVTGQRMAFWGIQEPAGDRAAVLVQDWNTGKRFYFPKDSRPIAGAPPLKAGTLNSIKAPPSSWQPGMTITPLTAPNQQGFSEVFGLHVRLEDCAQQQQYRVELVYCPAGGDCSAPAPVSSDLNGVVDYTFAFPLDGQYDPPSSYGYIYARKPETGEETIAWYQLAGGVGPAYIPGHAPLVDGAITTEPQGTGPNRDTWLLYSQAQSCTPPAGTFPAGVLGVAATPLRVQPVLVPNREGIGWGPNDPPLRVRLQYSQDLLDRLGITEEQLVVLHLVQIGKEARWELVPIVGRSRALDWVAIEAPPFGGQGEVFALGYGPARTYLPLVVRGP